MKINRCDRCHKLYEEELPQIRYGFFGNTIDEACARRLDICIHCWKDVVNFIENGEEQPDER